MRAFSVSVFVHACAYVDAWTCASRMFVFWFVFDGANVLESSGVFSVFVVVYVCLLNVWICVPRMVLL